MKLEVCFRVRCLDMYYLESALILIEAMVFESGDKTSISLDRVNKNH
jgi:hypothetical protein